MTSKNPKIEAIYPLSSSQQGYLFHHIMKKDDPGFLICECTIEGCIDIEKLQEAWRLTTLRHEVMRTSVHWKKIKRPVLLVRPEKEIQWSFLDWREIPLDQQNQKLEAYKKKQKEAGIVLEENPLSKISLIKITTNTYYFLWECHHLLLDGWSAIIILRDAFTYYDGLVSGTSQQLLPTPKLKSYRNWLKSQSLEDASTFWSKTFEGFKTASVFQKHSNQASLATPMAYPYTFESQVSRDLKNLAKFYRVTLNTLFQGIWSMALSRYFNTKDVTFGNTTSGRSIPFPNMDRMAGLFANVLPVRSILEPSDSFHSCIKTIQSQQQEARNYEYNKLDQISSWVNIPENKTLFDSLFIFEIPWEDITAGNLKVSNFKSGLSTTYPVTIAFKIEDCIQFELLVNTKVISDSAVDWFLETVPAICNVLLDNKNSSIEKILNKLPKTLGELS